MKFSRYHDKRRVFSCKKILKNHPKKTFITEDLTSLNHSVIKSLLPLKKDGSIDSFWTRDGRIIVKNSKTENPVRIGPADNIKFSLGLLPTENGDDAEVEPMSGEQTDFWIWIASSIRILEHLLNPLRWHAFAIWYQIDL